MSTITKERVTGIASGEKCYTHDDVVELARIALASLEAEPVAYVDPFAFNNFSVYRAGETDNKRMGREWMWANPDAGLIPVYTAPPTPAFAPEPIKRNDADGWWMYKGRRVGGGCAEWYNRALDDYRSAMLQGADGNSPVIPDGWVAVPVEPTEGMLSAAGVNVILSDDEALTAYKAMLAAAPQQEVK